ncbi:MAG: hypothetical protein QOH04_3194 [Sphingomonadales bacterium]|jgi:hypothetical protein|nr:hypothetical protein [Sphingomonadales bacterium]
MSPPRRAESLALPLLLAACALPLDEAARFRARLPALAGQPVALLERELGAPDGGPAPAGVPRQWGELIYAYPEGGGICTIEAAVDPADRIRSVTMTGDEIICGRLIASRRKDARRYAADPTFAAREREESRRMSERLVRARQEVNGAKGTVPNDCPRATEAPPR